MKVGDLVRFNKTGFFATILEISKGSGGRAALWVHGEFTPGANFKNPTHMTLGHLARTSEVVNESR